MYLIVGQKMMEEAGNEESEKSEKTEEREIPAKRGEREIPAKRGEESHIYFFYFLKNKT